MSEPNATSPFPANGWERKCILIEYEVATPISGLSPIPDLFSVRFACGWGGTGTTEIAALCDGVRTVRFFKGDGWMDALAQRFNKMPGDQVIV